MKKILRLIASLSLMGALAGCEWTGSGSGDSYSDNAEYSWVNFSGTYRGNNGYLVSNYSTSSGSSGSTSSDRPTANFTENHPGAAPAGPQTMVSGTLIKTEVVPGSVTILFKVGGTTVGSFRDDGAGKLTGTYTFGGGAVQGGGSGTVDYKTGAWTINLALPGLEATADIVETYAYYTSASSPSSGGSSSGVSGGPIYTFTVQQNGSSVVITDNNGATYTGVMSPPVFTSDNSPSQTDSSTTSSSGSGQVVAQFSANGVSAAGFNVSIVGTFQGYYTSDQRVTGRTIVGTWMEQGGKTGDISGQTQDAPMPSTTTGV